MKVSLQGALQKALKSYAEKKGVSLPEDFTIDLEIPRDPSHGDLTTSVAFRLAKWAKESPQQVASDLLLLLEKEREGRKQGPGILRRAEVAGGGFLNFFVPSSQLAEILVEIHQRDSEFGKTTLGAGKRVLIEFVSANPTGPLTVAHGRQAVLGSALAKILETTGYRVSSEYYVNDTGRQIGLLGESLWVRYQELFGKAGTIPEEGYQGEYLRSIAEKLRDKKKDTLLQKSPEEAIQACSEFAIAEILRGIQDDLKEIRAPFDTYASERVLREKKKVEEALRFLKGKDWAYESEGALWFRSTRFGDDKDRVLRKQTGDYTYLAPDIAYHRLKFERGFRLLINLWGPDHHGYVSRLKAACQALGHPSDQLQILIVQLVTLYREGEPVRMSTRAGEFVTLRELFREVGVDATRFFFLLRRVASHLDFDLDLAKKKSDENPVYYLQYAHARISSILEFAKKRVTAKVNLEPLGNPEETDLMKRLREYPQILNQAAEMLEPYRVVEYLRDLATAFHKFYTLHRVVTEDQELTLARLLLVDAVRVVLRNGLTVLGVSSPRKM